MSGSGNPSSGMSSNTLGIVLILLAVALLSSMDATVKLILEDGLSVMQMLAMRSWLVLPLLLVWMFARGGVSQLATAHKGLHFLRVFFGFGAPFFFFNAITILPLPEATVVFFSSTFIMTALSVPLLKEHVGIHRWSAIAVGFIGIVVAVNPTGDVLNVGALYAFAAAISYSMMMVLNRMIGNREGTFKLLFYFHAWIGLVSTTVVLAGIGGVTLRPEVLLPGTVGSMAGWGGIVAITVLVIIGHYCMMRAFSIAPVGLVAPFEYSAILWSTLFGYVIWNHVPGSHFWAGAMLVVASGSYMVYREARLKKLATATDAMASDIIIEGPPGPSPVPVPPSIAAKTD